MDDDLLIKSKTVCKNPDAIVNLYDYCVVWISDGLLKNLEYSSENVVGKSILNLFFGSSNSAVRKFLIKILSLTSMVKEITATTKSKKKLVIKAKFFNFKHEGTPFLVAKVLDYPKE